MPYKITKNTLFYYIYMIILSESTFEQTFNFIPREVLALDDDEYTITIHSETENKQVFLDTTTSFTAEKYYYTYSNVFSLKEDNFYLIKIEKQNKDVIFKDMIFCTEQLTVPEFWNIGDLYWNLIGSTWNSDPNPMYSVNQGNYVQHSSDNEFIII